MEEVEEVIPEPVHVSRKKCTALPEPEKVPDQTEEPVPEEVEQPEKVPDHSEEPVSVPDPADVVPEPEDVPQEPEHRPEPPDIVVETEEQVEQETVPEEVEQVPEEVEVVPEVSGKVPEEVNQFFESVVDAEVAEDDVDSQIVSATNEEPTVEADLVIKQYNTI